MLKESIDSHKFLELEVAGGCVEDEVHPLPDSSSLCSNLRWLTKTVISFSNAISLLSEEPPNYILNVPTLKYVDVYLRRGRTFHLVFHSKRQLLKNWIYFYLDFHFMFVIKMKDLYSITNQNYLLLILPSSNICIINVDKSLCCIFQLLLFLLNKKGFCIRFV